MKFCQTIAIVLIGVLTVIQYSLPAPIFPLEMKRRHISQTSIGVAMASYSFGYIIGSVFQTEQGRRTTIQCGLIVLAFALFLYSVTYFIPDHYADLFLATSIFLRTCEGLGTGIIVSALIALLSLIYPDERGRAISARSCGANLGMSLGPVLGGSLFLVLGYFGIFFSFAILTLLTALLVLIFKESRDNIREIPSQLNICQLLSLRRLLLNLVCNSLCDFLYLALEPTLAIKLRTDFNFSQSQIGIYFFIYFAGAALSMSAMILLPEEWDKRKLIAPSMILVALFGFLVGPSSIFHFPNSSFMIASGIFLTGAARGVSMALCPADAIRGGIKSFPQEEAKVSDLIASIYNVFFGLNTFLFPIIGSGMVKSCGFRTAMDSISIVLLLNSLLYLISTLSDWKREKVRQNERNQGQEERILLEAQDQS